MGKIEDKNIRKKFEATVLREAAVPNPKIFYVRRADECVCLDGSKGEHLWNTAILPHPDVALKDFFLFSKNYI